MTREVVVKPREDWVTPEVVEKKGVAEIFRVAVTCTCPGPLARAAPARHAGLPGP